MQLAIRFVLFVTVRLQSNYSELFGCNRAYTFNICTVLMKDKVFLETSKWDPVPFTVY